MNPNNPDISNCSDAFRLPLSRGMFALIDLADAESVMRHKWTAEQRKDRRWTACRKITTEDGKHKRVFLHHQISGLSVWECDHINRDPLDNRRSNLRKVTRLQNQMNKGPWGKVPLKGVSETKSGKFTAKLCFDGKQRELGYFKTAVEAAKAYDKAAFANYGEFAYLNFPNE